MHTLHPARTLVHSPGVIVDLGAAVRAPLRSSTFAAALLILAWMSLGGTAHAAPLRNLPDLDEIVVYETTFTNVGTSFVPDSNELTTRLADPLGVGNRDLGFIDDESYDLFYSDLYGNPDPDGSFLTIEGVWRRPELRPDGSMNINEVALIFGGSNPRTQYGDEITNLVIGSIHDPNFGLNYVPGSELLAVDHDLFTFPRLGQTSTSDLADRMRLTIGFLGISDDFSKTSVSLQLDPAQSFVTMTASVAGVIPFTEQSPGSLTTALQGSLSVDLLGTPAMWTDVRFTPADIDALGHDGQFLPGNAPADLAGVVNLNDDIHPVLGYAALRQTTVDLSSPFTPIDLDGHFSLDSLLTSVTGALDYNLLGQNVSLPAETLSTHLRGQGSMDQVGKTLRLTIPIDVSIEGSAEGLPVSYHFTGQIVATATVPEPSAFALAGLGMWVVCCTLSLQRRNRLGQADENRAGGRRL